METRLIDGTKNTVIAECPICKKRIEITSSRMTCPECGNSIAVLGYSESYTVPAEAKIKATGPKNFIHQNQIKLIIEDIKLGIANKYLQSVIVESLMKKYEGLSKSHANRKYKEVVGNYATGPHAKEYWAKWMVAHLDEFQRLGGTLKILWSVYGTDGHTERTWRGLERGEYKPTETFAKKYHKITGLKMFRKFYGELLDLYEDEEPFYPCEFCNARGTESCAKCVVLLHHLIPAQVDN